jgi:hypothetical protein
MSVIDQLPSLNTPVPKKSGLSFLGQLARQCKAENAKLERQKSKASLAMARKVIKMMEASGRAVSGVTIGPDGAVSVATTDAPQAKSANPNPWDEAV